MAGVTLSAANVERFVPRVVHEGIFSQTFRIDYNGMSISVSDIVVIGYLQPGVQVLSGFAWGGGSSAGDTFKFGVAGSDTALSTAIAVGATTVALAGFVPRTFSLSADAEGNLRIPVWATKSTGTMTATGSLNLTLYMMAPPI